MVSFVWLKRVRPIYRSMREDRSTIDARVTETFGGIRVVRSFRREPREEQNYAVGHHTVIRKGLLAEGMEILLGSIWGLLIPGLIIVLVWYGGHLVMLGKATDRRYHRVSDLRDAPDPTRLATRLIRQPDTAFPGGDGARL